MKPKLLIPFTVFFIIVLVTEIYAEHDYVLSKDFTFLGIMQPILLPGLIAYFIWHFKGNFTVFSKWVLLGLCMDWAADIILTFYRDVFNLPCMIGYFGGHVCYGIAFATSVKSSGYRVSLLNRFIFSLPPLFYILVYYLFIFNYISTHEVKNIYVVPATLYAVSILFMSTSALWRMGTSTETSYWCIAAGALLYMLSDSITGYDHFVRPVQMKYVASMFTYGISLYLFVLGTITHQPLAKKV